MASNGGRINFQVGFNVDKSGLNSLKSSLQSLQKMKITDFSGTNEELRQIKNTAKQVQQALQKAFNANLGSLNVNKFNQELQKSKLNVNQIYSQFSKAGAQGQAAFSKMAQSVLTTNLQLRQTNSLVSKMGTTLMNTIKWNISSSIVQNFTNSIRQAFQYVQALDASLTDIRIVTGDSTDQMREFARQANNAAQALGRSTMDYTKAALTFYQQGLDDQSVAARTQATLQAQNITGAGEQMADYLTAVWNGYKVANEQAQLYVDRLAAVADSSASNMAQLATAMSKVAATANAMGVDVDQLNAQIATIIATTRQAPETVGNALKTIFARINDIQAGTQDAEVSLGHYTGTMAELGINVLDASGHLRDTGQVMEEIGEKWATMSREQQIYLARTMAGQRQYNNLIALFDNWGRYTELVNVSMDSQGTLMEKNSRYMDSLGAKMEQLGAAGEKVKDALIDEQDMKGLITAATKIVSTFGSFIQGIGGARGALLGFGSIALQIFSGVISKEINTQVINLQNYKNNLDKINEAQERLKTSGSQFEKGGTAQYVGNLRALQQYWSVLSNEEKQAQQDRANEISSLRAQQNILEENTQKAKEFYQAITGKDLGSASEGAIERITGTIQSRVEALKQSLQEIHNNTILNQGTGFGISDEQKEQNIRALDELNEKTKELMQSLGTYGKAEGEEILNLINNMRNSSLGKQGLIDENELTNVIDKLDELSNKVQSQNGKVVNYRVNIQGAEEARQKADELQQTFDRINQEASQLFNIQSTVQFASSIGRLASSINTIVNLTKVWKNENLSLGEKLLQTFMSLGFAAGMFISSLKNITTFVAKAVKVTGDLFGAASEEVQTTFIQAHTEAIRDQIKEEDRLVLSKMLANKASLANIAATGQELAVTQQERIQKRLLSMEEQGHTKSVLANVAAKIKQFIAQKLLNEQRKKALLSMFPYIAAIAAITAAAIAATVAIYNLWTKSEKDAEKAAKAAQNAAQRYKQVKQAYDDLKSSLQDYNSAQDALNELTRGTQEWRDALLEANEAVLELLNTYPKLAQYVTNQNGRLVISEEGQQALLAQQLRSVETAQRVSVGLATESRQADIQNQAIQLSRASAGYFSSDRVLEIVNDYIASNGVLQGYAQTAQFQELVNSSGFRELVSAVQANTAAVETASAALIDNAFSEDTIYESFTEAGRQVAGEIGVATYEAQRDRIYSSIEGALDKWTRASSQVEIYRDINTGQTVINTLQDWVQEYTQAMGIQASLTTGNAVTKDDNGNLVVNLVNDITGEAIPVLQQYMQMTIATARAMDQVEGSTLENIRQINEAIENSGYEDALNKWITGNLGDLTEEQLNQLSSIANQLPTIFGDNLELVAAAVGSSTTNISNDLNSLVRQQQRSLQEYIRNLTPTVRTAFQRMKIADLTVNQQKQIAENLAEAFREGGSQALESLQNFYQRVSDFDALDQVNASFNFTNGTIDQLREALHDAGIATQFTNEELQTYINRMRQAGQVTNPEQHYAALHQIIDDLSFGDTISSQDAQVIREELQAHNLNLNDYFQIQRDGTYQLRASAQQFYDLINGFSLQPFERRIDQIEERLGHLGSWEGNNYSASVLGEQNFDQFSRTAYSYDPWSGMDLIEAQLANSQLEFLYAISDSLTDQQRDIIAEIRNTLEQQGASLQDLSSRDFSQISRILGQHEGQWLNISDAIEAANGQLQIYHNQLDSTVAQPIDSDINLEELDEYATYLENYAGQLDDVDNAVQDNREVALDLAQAILRYNHALEETIDNYDTWLAMLQSGNWQDHIQAVSQLRNTYADLLDLPFEAELSDAFLSNVDNLNLLRQAANGSEEAYNRLRQLAAQDLLIQVGIDPSQFSADVDWMEQAVRKFVGQDFGDIQVGAELNDQAFLQGLTDMVNAAGMTAQQATDYLSAMGIDAEVTTADNWTQGIQEYQDIIPSVKYIPVTSSYMGQTYKDQLASISFGGGGSKRSSKTRHNTPATAVRVTSAHKSSGGNFKFNHASNGSGAGRPSSSGGGGGGKGGSSKASQPSIQKPSQDQRDPYHDINRLLDKQSQKLDNIQKQDKKLVNRDRLNNINAQNKALEEQANLLENKLAIAESQEIRLRNQLLADTNGYAQFGTNGQITNFNQMLANAEKQYNDYIAYYNTLSKQQQDAEKDRLDLEKERYQRVKKTADEYEKTLDLQRDLLEQINEAQEKIYQNMIKQSQIRVDLAVDTGDLEREYLDFENKFIKKLDKDDFLGNAKANVKELMSYFNSDQIKKRNEEINSLNAIIQRIEKNGGGAYVDPSTGYNLAAAQERLSELFKDQAKALEEIDGLVKEIQELYLNSLKDAKDKMDDQIDQYERIGELIEHNAKLAQLIYGDKAYATLEKYYNLQQQNDERALNNLRMQQQYWQSQLDNEVVGTDAWLEIKKNLDDITDDLNDKLEDMIDRLADQWQVRVKKIMNQVNNTMTGGRGLDYLNEQWDYISDYDDNFLDTLESKFGIQQVETLYQQAIDSIQGDPRGQQRLNKLMNDQLKLLREKDKLTEYDVERAKAALEVEKARMAIEQARDSKTKMRLRRDSQGNYTYQYVADENKLSDLQQALNDAQANLYSMDKEHYTQNLNGILDAWQEFQQKLLELQFEYAQADAANNEEEKKRVNDRIELLRNSYSRLFEGLTEDNQYNLKYLAQSFGQGMGFTKAQQEAEDFIKIMEQNIPHVGGEVQNLTNAIIADGGLLNALSDLENGFATSNLQYVAGVQTYLAETGTTVDAIMQATDAYSNAMDTTIKKAQEFIPYYDKMIADSVDSIDQIRKSIEQVGEVLDKNLDDSSLVKTLETAVNLLQDLNRYKNSLTGEIAKDVNIKAPNVVNRNIDTTEEGAGVITAQDWKNYLNNQSTSQPITLASINAITQLDTDTLNNLSNSDLLLNVIGTVKYLTESMGSLVDKELEGLIKEASSYIGSIDNVETLNQNVHIEANFPNVKQHTEIEQAFNNLVNIASQYAAKPATV